MVRQACEREPAVGNACGATWLGGNLQTAWWGGVLPGLLPGGVNSPGLPTGIRSRPRLGASHTGWSISGENPSPQNSHADKSPEALSGVGAGAGRPCRGGRRAPRDCSEGRSCRLKPSYPGSPGPFPSPPHSEVASRSSCWPPSQGDTPSSFLTPLTAQVACPVMLARHLSAL